MVHSQYYFNTPQITPVGNPGNINWDDEEPYNGQAGWVDIQPSSHPAWTSSQSIPFTFSFNGSTVTSYKVSTTGLLTFSANPSTPASTHNIIPNSNLPDNTICVWGLGWGGSNSNDKIIKKVFGTAPNRQLWISYASYNNESLGYKCWAYWSIMLEETSNRIYIIDQRKTSRSGCGPALTLGIQISSTSAVMVPGSPNINPISGDSKTPYDNRYYEFIPGTRPQYDIGVDYVQTNQYQTAATQVEIRGTLKTYGSTTVTSYDINYQIDNDSIKVEHVTGTSIPMYSTEWFFHDSLWFPNVGSYTLKVWCSNINGNADQNIYNDTLTKAIDVLGVFVPRVGLHELFSSANSPECKGVHDSLLIVFNNNAGKYTYITYPLQTDIYTSTDAQARATYYGADSMPDMFLNGSLNIDPRYYSDQLFNDNSGPAYMNIIPQLTVNGNTIHITASILPFPQWANPSELMKIHVAIVEKTTTGNVGSNGETTFHHILRKMLPSAAGTPQTTFTSGIFVNVNESFTFQTGDVEDIYNLEAIVFVQNDVTKEIYQSATTDLSASINNQNGIQEGISNLYPNPTNSSSELEYFIPNSAQVGISVYDAVGRLVLDNGIHKVSAGKHNRAINLSAYNSGIYYIRLSVDNRIYYKKLMVN